MRFLAFVSPNPWATGLILVRHLRAAGHAVTAVAHKPAEGIDVVRPETFSARRLLDEIRPCPDVLFYCEGRTILPYDLTEVPVLTAWYAIDTHIHTSDHIRMARVFDVTFLAQKEYSDLLLREGSRQVRWLPLSADSNMFRDELRAPPRYDIAFVGNLRSGWHPRRRKLLEEVKKRHPNTFLGTAHPEEMAEIYGHARIVLNECVKNDINIRTFEGLMSGALLITPAISDNGFEELFEPGKHLVTYESEEDLFRKLDYYLKHEDERRTIAANGRRLAHERHAWPHRVEEIVRVLSGARRGARLESPAESRTLWTMYRLCGSKLGRIWCIRQALGRTRARRFLFAPIRAALRFGLNLAGGVDDA